MNYDFRKYLNLIRPSWCSSPTSCHILLVTKLTSALKGLNTIRMAVGHSQTLSAVLSPERVAYFYTLTLLRPFRAYLF